MEGYLSLKLNNFLRSENKTVSEKIKYYYTSLLASFQFFSHNTEYNKDQNLVVYRANICSDEEYLTYERKNNSNMIRIFKEFLSTSLNRNIAYDYLIKDNTDFKEFFWEITIPKEIIKNEPNIFANISQCSRFPDENEILIKSGAIIHIERIVPLTEEIDKQIIVYKNKFKKICTLKSFTLTSILKLVLINPSIQKLTLTDNNLGSNELNMLYLKEAIEKNNSIHSLILTNNNLGANENNMLYLSKALVINNSIIKLSQINNNLGENVNKAYVIFEGSFNKQHHY